MEFESKFEEAFAMIQLAKYNLMKEEKFEEAYGELSTIVDLLVQDKLHILTKIKEKKNG